MAAARGEEGKNERAAGGGRRGRGESRSGGGLPDRGKGDWGGERVSVSKKREKAMALCSTATAYCMGGPGGNPRPAGGGGYPRPPGGGGIMPN